jgi:N utilization substance protein A
MGQIVQSLMQIVSVSDARAQMMVQNGIMSIADLSATDSETLAGILSGNEADAKQILKDTHDAIEKGTINLEDDEEELVSASAVPAYKGLLDKHKEAPADGKDKFSEAERRLREELAAFKLK